MRRVRRSMRQIRAPQLWRYCISNSHNKRCILGGRDTAYMLQKCYDQWLISTGEDTTAAGVKYTMITSLTRQYRLKGHCIDCTTWYTYLFQANCCRRQSYKLVDPFRSFAQAAIANSLKTRWETINCLHKVCQSVSCNRTFQDFCYALRGKFHYESATFWNRIIFTLQIVQSVVHILNPMTGHVVELIMGPILCDTTKHLQRVQNVTLDATCAHKICILGCRVQSQQSRRAKIRGSFQPERIQLLLVWSTQWSPLWQDTIDSKDIALIVLLGTLTCSKRIVAGENLTS